MARFPVRDCQVASKATSAPSPSVKTFCCVYYKKGSYGHCNEHLQNYLAFYCSTCRNWFCGLCYSVANKSRELDECCPGKCGTVTSADQLITRDWFPTTEKRVALTMVPKVTATNPLQTTSAPNLNESGGTIAPPDDPWTSALDQLTQVYQQVKRENQELKRKLEEVDDVRSKYESLKKKVSVLLEDLNK